MNDTLLVSTRKGLFMVIKRDGRWVIDGTAFLGDNVTLSFPDPRDGTWYAALNHGHFGVKLHRSHDRGRSWEEVDAPKYPPKPETSSTSADEPKDVDWSLKLIWSMEGAGNDRPGELWCGTIPGGLFRTRDRGETWTLVTSLWNHPDRRRWMGGGADQPGIHSILVDPQDSRHVLVGVSCGGVWETLDDGESWTVYGEGLRAEFMPPEQQGDPVAQDPHCIVACPSDFRQQWMQHHCGIWRSEDGGHAWVRIEHAGPSTFGFAVAVHPIDPKLAWFVPAINDEHRIPVDGKVVVTRTRDGGKTFDVLRRGLPQEHSYDLTFRHALAIAPNGESLAFGSTTGGVWVSDDQGDSWATVSSHLPPVYAVRFAS